MPKSATCHPDKPHYAKGFCKACYNRDRRQAGLVTDRTKYNRQAKYRQTEKGKAANRRYQLRRKEREIASNQ